MKHTKNQHYVPQFLLRNFSSSNKSFVWTYDKFARNQNWTPIKERPINKVASEDFFYDQIQNNKEFSFEYELGRIERETAPIIEKILIDKSLLNLTNDQREKFSLFIASQFVRTRSRLNQLAIQSLDFSHKLEKVFDIVPEKIDPKSLWFSLFESAEEFAIAIKNKMWFLGESDQLFYLSDNPVVLQNIINKNEVRGTLGLDSYGIEIYMPLSHSIILCCFCEKFFKDKYGILNLEKFSYENVVNVNALQFFQSERFIFSSLNNFEMISKSIDI